MQNKRKARSSLDSRNVDYSKNTQGESYEFGFYLGALLRLVAQTVKNLPVMQETWVQSLGWKDTLEAAWLPTPIFLPREFHGQRSLAGYSQWGCKELDVTE